MLRFVLAIFLIPLLPLQAQAYWKHHQQQGDVDSCHSFTTVALIEAKYWQETGKHIDLSERDLFLRHFTQGHANASALIDSHLRAAMQQPQPDNFREAGHIKDDFVLAQLHGIASERELAYNPLFKPGLAMSINRLRQARKLLGTECQLLQLSHHWDTQTADKKLREARQPLRGLASQLTPAPATTTRTHIRQWLASFQLITQRPRTSQQAKSQILSALAHGPVATDVTNFTELTTGAQQFARDFSRHSLVVHHYDAAKNQFSIRSSTFKGQQQVSAAALARGCYQLHFIRPRRN